ncbi:SemiSWEET family sugar transporter [Muricoccus aerilatus]|uniref:SemiSWEET family sugar transporter n=1 Tax=Muricoccus aerilatus TaxID=452982 RepID=UPI0005C24C75|nr:SemiSWEET transporter [Roseomonas aerilata]
MDGVEWLGVVAGILTTIAFVPQVLRTHRTRSASDLSMPMLMLFTTGVGLWLAYGLLIGSNGIIMANAATMILSAYILGMKLRFG